ncbi:MAG: response regulator, partial [Bacteroidota bacterium]
MDPINIFIADAAFLVREGIKAVIQDKDYMKVVGEAVHSDELKKKLKQTSSDLVIIDYEASESFDVDDIKDVIQQHPDTNVLVISTDYEKERVLKAINYGAKGFLLKECDQT